MAKGDKNAGFAGRTVVETVEFTEATGLVVRGDPESASSRERGRKRPQPPLSREAALRFLESLEPHVEWLEQVHRGLLEDYEQSCREQIRVRTVVKENYIKLEIVMRPGQPQERCLDLPRQLETRVNQARKALEGEWA